MFVTRRGGHRFCPRRAAYRWVDESRLSDPDATVFRDVECGALICPYCIETDLWKWTVSFEHAAPERFAVFTQLSGDWQRDRRDIQTLLTAIRRGAIPGKPKPRDGSWEGFPYVDPQGRARTFRGAVVESAYTVEAGAKTGMVHLNFFWHGGFVPQSFLVEVAAAIGWGRRVSVNKWEPAKAGAGGYGMKEARAASGYGMKEARATSSTTTLSDHLQPSQAAFLERNGGRLMHTTRGFWRAGPGGASLHNQRAAFRSAMATMDAATGRVSGTGAGSWVQYGPGRDVVVAHSPLCGNDRSARATRPDQTGASESAGPPQPSPLWDGDLSGLSLVSSTS